MRRGNRFKLLEKEFLCEHSCFCNVRFGTVKTWLVLKALPIYASTAFQPNINFQ